MTVYVRHSVTILLAYRYYPDRIASLFFLEIEFGLKIVFSPLFAFTILLFFCTEFANKKYNTAYFCRNLILIQNYEEKYQSIIFIGVNNLFRSGKRIYFTVRKTGYARL